MIALGNITISLEKGAEETLRSVASKKYKNKKGSLAKVVSESLGLLSKNSKRQRAMMRQFRWMDQEFDLGKILVKKREDIYGRK